MQIDFAQQIRATERRVEVRQTPDGEVVAVVMSRRYDTQPADVWTALTDPERVRRWFLPLSGDLQEGGNFQLEGNAGGDILVCDAPRLLKVTFGDVTSLVELRLTEEAGGTALVLEHSVPMAMAQSGAGALWVGPGWDGAFMGLDLYVRGEAIGDPVEAANSPEVQAFSKRAIDAWTAVIRESGTATEEQVVENEAIALAQFVPDSEGAAKVDPAHREAPGAAW